MGDNLVKVTIKASGDLEYDPGNTVWHGCTVRFVLDPDAGPPTATVNPPDCLVDKKPVTLRMPPEGPTQYDDLVDAVAPSNTYAFTVEVPTPQGNPRLESRSETKNGNLEVTTDPPEED
ncbi:hypothetical protein [Myxococcus sp. Y35]|uniref:hypothetical protein n=1 Tax=Pseudomyxococcus flavus TaxID=3115648 RepID=UPI003CF441E0